MVGSRGRSGEEHSCKGLCWPRVQGREAGGRAGPVHTGSSTWWAGHLVLEHRRPGVVSCIFPGHPAVTPWGARTGGLPCLRSESPDGGPRAQGRASSLAGQGAAGGILSIWAQGGASSTAGQGAAGAVLSIWALGREGPVRSQKCASQETGQGWGPCRDVWRSRAAVLLCFVS